MTQPNDASRKSPRTFQCRDQLWETFEQMARELECSIDYLINESMKQYARQRSYGPQTQAGAPANARTPFPGARDTGMDQQPPPPQRAPLPPTAPAAPMPMARPGAAPAAPTPPPMQSSPGRLPPPPPPAQGGRLPPPPPATGRQPPPPVAAAPPPVGRAPVGGPPPLPRGSMPPQMPAQQHHAPPPPPPPQQHHMPPPQQHMAPPQQHHMAPPQQHHMPAPPPPPPQQHHNIQQAPPPQQPGNYLGALTAIYQGERTSVNKEKFIIGRGRQTSDLTIKDPNVSRQHAMIEFQNGVYYMVDLGSTNGVEYQGQRVTRKAIAEGDTFRICDHDVVFTYR